MELSVFDLIILSVVILSAFIGLLRGVVREILSLITWVLAFWVSIFYNQFIADLLTFIETTAVRHIVAGSLIFISILLLGAIINFIIGRMLKLVNLGSVDRIFGFLFGVLRGALIVFVGIFLGQLTPVVEIETWQESKLIPTIESAIDTIKGTLSEETQEKLNIHFKKKPKSDSDSNSKSDSDSQPESKSDSDSQPESKPDSKT